MVAGGWVVNIPVHYIVRNESQRSTVQIQVAIRKIRANRPKRSSIILDDGNARGRLKLAIPIAQSCSSAGFVISFFPFHLHFIYNFFI